MAHLSGDGVAGDTSDPHERGHLREHLGRHPGVVHEAHGCGKTEGDAADSENVPEPSRALRRQTADALHFRCESGCAKKKKSTRADGFYYLQ